MQFILVTWEKYFETVCIFKGCVLKSWVKADDLELISFLHMTIFLLLDILSTSTL